MKLHLFYDNVQWVEWPKTPCFNLPDIQKKSAIMLAKPAWITWSAILGMFPLLSTGRRKKKPKNKSNKLSLSWQSAHTPAVSWNFCKSLYLCSTRDTDTEPECISAIAARMRTTTLSPQKVKKFTAHICASLPQSDIFKLQKVMVTHILLIGTQLLSLLILQQSLASTSYQEPA